MDLKETEEMIEAFSLFLKVTDKVLEDKKLGIDDAAAVLELFKEYETFVKAYEGASNIPAELKDLSQEELITLATKMYPLLTMMRQIILRFNS